MNEFQLIDRFFKSLTHTRTDVVLGIGDDAACLQIPLHHQLLVSSDTLVSGVHFLPSWDAYDVATKAVMVNVSDIAAMAGQPCWMTLALTLPTLDSTWLQRFSEGLRAALQLFDIALIGGDTTRGPLSMTLTVHGLVATGCALTRRGARAGDVIYVSGSLGAAACALSALSRDDVPVEDLAVFMQHLHAPKPRIDLASVLQRFATSAIDLSDGLAADLAHVCDASGVGACLDLTKIPVHPLVQQYSPMQALDLALHGGDDYELCFTVPEQQQAFFDQVLTDAQFVCYPVGIIEEKKGLRAYTAHGDVKALPSHGYKHF